MKVADACRKKQGWATKEQAERQCRPRRTLLFGRHSPALGGPTRAYKCPNCGDWHVSGDARSQFDAEVTP
jgi:hypothetical protein